MSMPASDEAIRAALTFISPAERSTWIMVGMGLKDELGDGGFDMFDQWSNGADNYNAKDVRSAWKSFKPGGGVTIASVIAEAKKGGFDPKSYVPAWPISLADKERVRQEQAERDRQARAEITAKQEEAALKARMAWDKATEAGASKYLAIKGIKAHGVRFAGDSLLVPLVDVNGKHWNNQRIPGNGSKTFLKDGKVSGCFHVLGDASASNWILIAEGYATSATLREATGHPVVAAMHASNLKHAVRAMKKRHPQAKLLICADDDSETKEKTGKNPGVEAAIDTAGDVGAHWCKPEGLPRGGTDFNDLANARGIEAVREQIARAIEVTEANAVQMSAPGANANKNGHRTRMAPASSEQSAKPYFEVDDGGVWHHGFDREGAPLPRQWICSALYVTAKSRDAANAEWGYLLECVDPDGMPKRWAMPASMLAGDGTQYRATLLSMGLQIAAGMQAKNLLTVYIQTRQTDVRVRCTDRIGWHDDVYVLPDRTIGEGDELVMFQSAAGIASHFKQRGTLDEWRTEVAALCQGNSRLMFCVSVAFAATLLHHSGVPSGGFHIWGDSSSGKSTAFKVAGSVYGGKDYPRNWRMTDNALETVAAQHSDALLLLDEIAQVDPKVVGDTVYMLANETGKGRATQTATARRVHTWRTMFLSDGEISLANHMAEAGKGVRSGHDVRMAHIAADAGKGLGVYETLHDFANGAAFSDHLVKMAQQHYGTAGLAFIEWAVTRAPRLPDALRSRINKLAHELCPTGAHGQVSRVAARFALVGVAGEAATEAGITGWENGAALDAMRACFAAWLEGRGGAGNTEHTSMLRQVSGFFQAHGESRFTWWHRAMDDHKPNTPNRAGFKRLLSKDGIEINSNTDHGKEFGERMHSDDGEESQLEYFVMAEVFRTEICKGFSPKAVAQLLIEREWLVPSGTGEKQRPDSKVRLPGIGNTWCSRFSSKVASAE